MNVDTVFRDANVITLDAERPRATALAVLGDRIVAVGGDASGLTAERVVSLDGATVVPGFNDAHNHSVMFGLALGELALGSPPMGRLEDVYDAVAAEAQRRPAGSWIVGWGYDQNKLGGRHPHRAELDRAAPDHLVWLKHTSGHMAVVNGRALDAAGVGAVGRGAATVPEGGVVVRDESGAPTGLLQEQAQLLVRGLVYPYSQDELVAAIGRAHERYLSEGLTSVCEAGIGGGWVGHSPAELAAFQEARATGALRVRTTAMVAAEALHDVAANATDDAFDFGLDLGLRSGLGDEWLRIGAVKVFADGSLIGRTAAMFDDFEGEPGNRGFFQADPERLRATILRAHRAGWQVATHAIGDRAVATVVDVYEEALAAYPRADHRHRIEHCGVAGPDVVARIARLGVIPSPQARFVSEIGDGMMDALGPERTASCYRQRSFVDAGIELPASSDRPVVQGAPLLGLHDLVNRRTASGRDFGPAEALEPLRALRCYTLGSAFASFEEHRKGSLAPGKLADLAVLSDDPTAVPPEAIRDLGVLATVVGGQVAFDAMGIA